VSPKKVLRGEKTEFLASKRSKAVVLEACSIPGVVGGLGKPLQPSQSLNCVGHQWNML